ncbi:uncharacterized protein SOCEGT47_018450 [Sorangium cellulosum]|uniref:Uncharacterized protein n=1 Tax=Sorangium cellulosum TaxID=56 RepID=A0A4P2PXY0_SORCE|nr:uncharacterized protein SOCEGT47_018450 [Sorangium cellulosum]
MARGGVRMARGGVRMADRHVQMADRHVQMADRHVQMADRHVQMADRPRRAERRRQPLAAESAEETTSLTGTPCVLAAAAQSSNSGLICGGPNGPSLIFTRIAP